MVAAVHQLSLARFECADRQFGLVRCTVHGVEWGLGVEFHPSRVGRQRAGEEAMTLWATGRDSSLYDVVGARAGVPGAELREIGPRIGAPRVPLLVRGRTR